MDAFLTTYRKDYRWPVLYPSKAGPKETPNIKKCFSEPLTPQYTKHEIQSLQISAAPQSENSKLNQPDAFLNQVYQKNPYLYSFKKESPSDDVKQRILSQRLITTYQRDYGGTDSHLGHGDRKICCCKNREGQEARFTSNQPIAIPKFRVHLIAHPSTKGPKNTQPGVSTMRPGVSEYVDTISKNGLLIMRSNILSNPQRKYHFTNS